MRVMLVGLALGALLAPGLVGAANAVCAADTPAHDAAAAANGASAYQTYCATCHGKSARGDGPVAKRLEFAPSDLTALSRRNRGRYPFDRVFQIIDGRRPVKGHGGAGMPVWGDAFLGSGGEDDQQRVKDRINALVHYLASLQEPKPAP
jgi:mono/diheme cytochrome c family protein